LSRGTPVAALIVIRPGIQINPIERDAAMTDGNFRDDLTHFAIEATRIHAEINRRVAQSHEARQHELRTRPVRHEG
jgi:hypothetical protein